MLANGRQHLQLTQNNNCKFYTSEAAQPQGQALHSYHKPFNPIQHSLNHMDYKQILSAAHMTSDIVTQLHYTDLWYKSSHRQCTKELPWIYLSKGKDLNPWSGPWLLWAMIRSENQLITWYLTSSSSCFGTGNTTCMPDHCPGPEFLNSRELKPKGING